MNYTKEALLREPVFRYFHEICQIPRPSKKEKRISDFILSWARAQGLAAEQDAVYNVLIRKPAAPGYEAAPVVMLQAHMDMVCEKAPGVGHDFDTDPILWQIEGDLLTTGGRTTLGADDGIGMAFAMAILAEEGLGHPALEVLFTVAEEEDFTGAEGFDASRMQAARLINLDHACGHEILCGSCGGMAADLTVPVSAGPVPAGWAAYELGVSGLQGGHSGEDIHRGHGNANTLLARLLLAFEGQYDFLLGPITGGSLRLAIPRDARAVVCFPKEQAAGMERAVRELEGAMRGELPATGSNLRVTFEPTGLPAWCAPAGPVLTAAILAPDGIYQMNESLLGLVDASDNLGELYLEEGRLHLVFEIRAARKSTGDYLFQRMQRVAQVLGGQCVGSKEYPSWEFQPDSPLRKIACGAYQEMLGGQPDCLTVHAGLEVGILSSKKPGLDGISIGPDCWNFHSPSEKVSISSTQKTYQLLKGILANCR